MNTSIRAATVAASAIGLVAVALPVAFAGPASAREVERKGACSMGVARYDFSVEKEHGRFDLDFDVESKAAGEKWRVTLRHDKKVVHRSTRTTDREGEFDVDRNRPNTKGKDKFVARAKNLATGEICKAKITFAK